MTLFYPDISAYNAGISIAGAPAVCIKVTEGTGWLSSDYGGAMARARSAGAFAFAYHFLHAGNGAGQAEWCHRHTGGTPLMLDVEAEGSSRPGVGDVTAFLDAYERAGGTCRLTYLPHWYWQSIGSPSLGPLAARRQAIVSSAYTAYSDAGGVGWQPYGGLHPQVWQYTDRHAFNGQRVDFNAFRGSIEQFRALAGGSGPPPPPPAPVRPGRPAPAFPYPASDWLGQPSQNPHNHSGYYGGEDTVHVHTWQTQMAARGWAITQDGRFGQQAEDIARAYQAEKGLGVDGKVGPATWAASWTAPVTP